jgi:2,3-dihydroxybenzoate-AMP ligase
VGADRTAGGRAGGAYLEGALPYPPEVIEEYVGNGWWPNQTYVDLFERAVGRDPERESLVDDRRRLRWIEVEREVAALACALRDRGLGRYDRAVVQLPNRAEYLVVFHALQRVAAVPVPVVPRLGVAELRALIELTEPAAWFFPARDRGREFAPVVEALRRERLLPPLSVVVDDGEPAPEGTVTLSELVRGHDPDRSRELVRSFPRPDPNDVAVIFLTGGATGRSKAVPRTHNSFLGNMMAIAVNRRPDDVLIACTPVAHGMANQGPLGGWLLSGARLVLVGTPRARAILEAVSRERVTSMVLVPALLKDLLEEPDLDRYDLSSLRTVGSTSSHLDRELALRARRFFEDRGCTFIGSAYGCTEGPSIGHAADEPLDRLVGTVGRPTIPGHRWVVVDPEGRELPPGQVGELAVRGPSVFTGYYRAPEENRRIFTPSGYYRTGDQGFIDAEGYVHLTGRLKDIIQRGGEAVVPAEMEELILQHPAVSRAAVVAMPDPRLGERACAYVVLRPGASLTLEELVDFLRSRGAGPLQWPERLELVPSLPETAAGKLDRVALRADAARKVQAAGPGGTAPGAASQTSFTHRSEP